MPTTLLCLPVEIRLKIYDCVLSSSNIHSIRPQRKVGWNRPHADLSNPVAFFESESHPLLTLLFHSKITKLDHPLILASILQHIKVLIVDHADFAALQKLASTSARAGPGSTMQLRSNATIVKENLRTVDFSDKLDEVVCQPSDLTKLLSGFPGLTAVHLASKHVQRYSGTINDHVDFARDRAARDQEDTQSQVQSPVPPPAVEQTMDEFRRMNLRSPMTDGSRMVISPALFSRRSGSCRWVVVDLSMIVWQHFLYTGAPYKDHWRCVKMQTLLQVAEHRGVHVVMNFRNIEFDPPSRGVSSVSTRSNRFLLSSTAFRGEMNTADWVLKLRHRGTGVEYAVRQRRQHDVPVSQEDCGLTQCKHSKRAESLCKNCAEESRIASEV